MTICPDCSQWTRVPHTHHRRRVDWRGALLGLVLWGWLAYLFAVEAMR